MTDHALILWAGRQEAAERERLEGYRRRWEYYLGAQPKTLPVRPGQPDDNVTVNLTQVVVDTSAAFLFGREVTWELAEGEETAEERHLQTVWQANRKNSFLLKMAKSGGIYGQVFVKIVPDGIRRGVPRLISLEPEYVSVLLAPEDVERVEGYRIAWTSVGSGGRPEYHRQEIIRLGDDAAGDCRWRIENRVSRGSGFAGGGWEPDPRAPDLTWAYAWPPIIECQNLPLPGSYYGQADAEDASLQNAINYVASKIQRILRYHAHPKTIGAGFRNTDVEQGEDDMLILPTPEASIRNLEMQTDLSASLGYLDRLLRWYLRTSRTPDLDPAQVNVGALSGFALQILYGAALEKVGEKRLTYGDLLVELNRRLLDLAGYGADHVCTLHWPEPLPEDETSALARDAFELGNEVASLETIRARRGLDHEVEAERVDAEQRAKQERDGDVGAALMQDFFTNQRQGAAQRGGRRGGGPRPSPLPQGRPRHGSGGG